MWWNWSTHNTIVFEWWQTSSRIGLFAATLLTILITIIYEAVAFLQAKQDREAITHQINLQTLAIPPMQFEAPGKLRRALMYGLRTYLSILLMLIIMSFNGFLILAVVFGAIIAHHIFGHGSGCH